MFDRFMLCTFKIEPEWVGALVYASAWLTLIMLGLLVTVVFLVTQPLVVIVAALSIIGYAWVVALFFQKGN